MRVTSVVYILILGFYVVGTDPVNEENYSCYNNQTMCVMDMRKLLVDNTTFWFGTDYKMDCPDNVQNSPACDNLDVAHGSILSRLLNTTDSIELMRISEQINLAHVNFTSREGQFYSCGHIFTAPALTNLSIDPLHITQNSSWSLAQVPNVTWTPSNDSIPYTVLVWDAGHLILHSLYINCVNGSLATGQAVMQYSGPKHPYLTANPYLFLVYEQNATLDMGSVAMFVSNISTQNQNRFYPAIFFSKYGGSFSNSPSFANIMTVVGDPYSVQAQKDAFLINNCPFLISQLPVFSTVAAAINLSVSWSEKNSNSSMHMITPYVKTLRASIEVEYSTDDYSIESCCSLYSLTRGMFRVDPFNPNTTRPGMVRLKPQVRFSPVTFSKTGITEDVHTLFLVDVAPAIVPGAQNPRFITHWLTTNIRNGDVSTGDELAPYFGPNPFTPNDSRPFMFLLVKQPTETLNNSVLAEFCPNGYQRCFLTLKSLMDRWNLHEIVGLTWFRAEQDAFARYRLYSVLNANNKTTACNGVAGFSDPCPKTCTDSATIHGQSTLLFLTVLATIIALLVL